MATVGKSAFATGRTLLSAPATSQTPGDTGVAVSLAVAARIRQLAAQAEYDRAVAESRARRAADQQQRINALLLEVVDALARLLG